MQISQKPIKLLILNLLIILYHTGFGQVKTLYDFSAVTLDGKPIDFSSLKGKKVLIINTATKCSLAPQFNKLQELYKQYGGEKFEIIAFPSNDFGNQEPGNNMEIKQVCSDKYKITFPVMEKISIRENPHPVFKWLTSKKENGYKDAKVIWNFQKFLIDEEGRLTDILLPVTSPASNKIKNWIISDKNQKD